MIALLCTIFLTVIVLTVAGQFLVIIAAFFGALIGGKA